MFSARVVGLIAGKVGYTVSCFLAAVLLVVSGYAHKAVADLSAIGGGITIGGSSSVGAMNILVMGLESRTNFEGQCLSAGLLTAMHAGNVASCEDQTVGSQDTDTLILVHIFAGGQKAVGYSIPRDDLVTYPKAYYDGITPGKIDQAYYSPTSPRSTRPTASPSAPRSATRRPTTPAREAELDTVRGGHRGDDQQLRGDEPRRLLHPTGAGLRRHRGMRHPHHGQRRGRREPVHDQASGWNAVADGYNTKKGGSAVPAPGGGPGARVRPRPRQPARHRPQPHPPPAGRHRLRDLGAQARERVRRPHPDRRPRRRRQPVGPH